MHARTEEASPSARGKDVPWGLTQHAVTGMPGAVAVSWSADNILIHKTAGAQEKKPRTELGVPRRSRSSALPSTVSFVRLSPCRLSGPKHKTQKLARAILAKTSAKPGCRYLFRRQPRIAAAGRFWGFRVSGLGSSA